MSIKNLVLLLGLGLVAANPIVPDCIKNYTTFYNKYLNVSNTSILANYTDLSGEACGKRCSLLDNCTSFNYFPEEIFNRKPSECSLLVSKYNATLLIPEINVGFFLKSHNDCAVSKAKNIALTLLLSLFIILSFIGICYYCIKNNRNKSSYDRL